MDSEKPVEDLKLKAKLETEESNKKDGKKSEIIYGLNDHPPWYLCIIFAIQHCFLSLGGTIGAPLAIASSLCISAGEEGNQAKAYIIGSVLVVNGFCSVIQSVFGTRLPIMQGSSFTFIVPAFSILGQTHNACPAALNLTNSDGMKLYNETLEDGSYATFDDVWMKRMRELQGGLILASVVEILIGATGLVGLFVRLFGPLTITTTITLIGIELVHVAPIHAKHSWGAAFFTAFILIITSQWLKNVKVPFFGISRRKRRCKTTWTRPFTLFPVLFALVFGWIFCLILTSAGVFSDDPNDISYLARSDSKLDAFRNSPWFRFPYPGQWGLPLVTISAFIGMLSAVIASVIESIGDYNACASMCEAPPLPNHATNRGIMMEGFGCLLAGLVGTSTGTTSYSENIAAIGITRVGSRRVMQVAGTIMMLMGFVSKIGAFFVSIPEPVYGGIFMVVFGMVIAIGLSNLQYVDLTSNRNIFVIGFSFYMGLMVPYCVKGKYFVIETGLVNLDNTINVILESSLTVGALVAALVDNLLPGTDEERGLGKKGGRTVSTKEEIKFQAKCFNPPMLPCYKRSRVLNYIPFMPNGTSDDHLEDGEPDRVEETAASAEGVDNAVFTGEPREGFTVV